ncbi:carboxypeptidase regulatory-like domain-containing protein [Pedobacter rhodius]|uniref:Carboxypeptidase regulatory-like domain-containing protein n=1 Tax=Pedobacter rhodius TaxID=3004098 RepID=A0ABT4KY38_9SPHI|nr:carboxypeptidase regulatory-like domain-containing protein [Pedobacter sp. SJ11]MCZ4223845.1 carboxypeptidase regulatory-like domain-containing protein [Pedobacter sp. SJ11]
MKKLNIIVVIMVMLPLILCAFANIKLGGITGKITPVTGTSAVALVAGTDTLRAELNQGIFSFTNLKEGVYKVWIKGNAPYKDATIENVAVKDSSTTDLGEIKLQQ